jgi:hypothetical protein
MLAIEFRRIGDNRNVRCLAKSKLPLKIRLASMRRK